MKEQDVINQLYYAKKKGLAEGREEGLAEGEAKKSLEIAKKMLEMGLSVEQITEATGLSEDDVLKLKSE